MRKVYVAAAGFSDCDAFVSVVGNTAQEVLTALGESIGEECKALEDEEKSADELADDVWSVGPFAEDIDSLHLNARQLGELNGGWQVRFYNSPDAPEVQSGKLTNAVGFSDVLPTEDEAQRMAQEARESGAWVEVEVQKVAPSVTYQEVP